LAQAREVHGRPALRDVGSQDAKDVCQSEAGVYFGARRLRLAPLFRLLQNCLSELRNAKHDEELTADWFHRIDPLAAP
jgi:hypothetical protein